MNPDGPSPWEMVDEEDLSLIRQGLHCLLNGNQATVEQRQQAQRLLDRLYDYV